jgi:hypothetical protein
MTLRAYVYDLKGLCIYVCDLKGLCIYTHTHIVPNNEMHWRFRCLAPKPLRSNISTDPVGGALQLEALSSTAYIYIYVCICQIYICRHILTYVLHICIYTYIRGSSAVGGTVQHCLYIYVYIYIYIYMYMYICM